MADSLAILSSVSLIVDTVKFAEAERKYQEYLSSGGGHSNSQCHNTQHPPLVNHTAAVSSVHETESPLDSSFTGLSALSQQVAQARQQIQSYLRSNGVCSQCSNCSGGAPVSAVNDAAMEVMQRKYDEVCKEMKELRQLVKNLSIEVAELKGQKPKAGGDSKPPAAAADDDDDVDLFGSDDEEEDEAAAKLREQRLAAYAEKKSKKAAVIAKSNVILDVKPWDDETDMKELEKCVRKIEMDGLLWGTSKLVPLAYGIKKLQIASVVEDEKVSVDELTELILENEDYVQSVDIAAFQKI